MSIFGVVALLIATPWGLNLVEDSEVYVSIARNVIRGYGLGMLDRDGNLQQTLQYPPLYPLLLAMVAAVSSVDILVAARWLQALLFGATLMLVCLIVVSYNRGSFVALLLAGVLTITGGSLLMWYASAMSEGLFIFSGLLALVLLANYLEHGGPWILLTGAATATAAAVLTRYAGLAVLITGAGLLLLSRGTGFRRRMWRAGLFSGISGLPLVLWLEAGQMATSSPATSTAVAAAGGQVVANRQFGLHLVTFQQLAFGPLTVARWLVPEGVLRSVEAVSPVPSFGGASSVGLIGIGAACAGLGLLGVVTLVRQIRWFPASLPGPAARLAILFSALYVGFLLLTMSVANPSTEFSLRTLTPVYMAVVVVLPGALLAWWRSLRDRPSLRLGLASLGALVLVGNLVQTALWVREGNLEGLGFGKRVWQHSALVARARALPPNQWVYTNSTAIVSLDANRPAEQLPKKTGDSQAEYLGRLAIMQSRLLQNTAVLIYFDHVPATSERYASIEELIQSIHLRAIDSAPEGTIYTAD